MTRQERDQLVDFALRFSGLTWVQLGRLFGITGTYARIAVKRELRRRP